MQSPVAYDQAWGGAFKFFFIEKLNGKGSCPNKTLSQKRGTPRIPFRFGRLDNLTYILMSLACFTKRVAQDCNNALRQLSNADQNPDFGKLTDTPGFR
jgi:hypothetical protein